MTLQGTWMNATGYFECEKCPEGVYCPRYVPWFSLIAFPVTKRSYLSLVAQGCTPRSRNARNASERSFHVYIIPSRKWNLGLLHHQRSILSLPLHSKCPGNDWTRALRDWLHLLGRYGAALTGVFFLMGTRGGQGSGVFCIARRCCKREKSLTFEYSLQLRYAGWWMLLRSPSVALEKGS